MRVLSVKQPWAGLLMAGQKRFEVRTWRPAEDRGLVLLHASSGTASLSDVEDDPLFHAALRSAGMPDRRAWIRGGILGVVEFRRIITPPKMPKRFTATDALLCGDTSGVALWETGGLFPFAKPVPCHGRLNLWRPDASQRRSLASRLKTISLPDLPWLETFARRL
jgi:hypothetical protein